MLSSASTLSTNQTQVPLTAHAPHNHTADCQCSQAAAIHPANFLPVPPNDEVLPRLLALLPPHSTRPNRTSDYVTSS